MFAAQSRGLNPKRDANARGGWRKQKLGIEQGRDVGLVNPLILLNRKE